VSVLHPHDVQGLLFSGYKKRPYASYLLLTFAAVDAARAWVAQELNYVLFGDDRSKRCGANLAITASGLKQAGIEQQWIETFSPAFWNGMASAYRSRILGDVGINAPEHWEWGAQHEVHALLALFSAEPEEHARFVREQRDLAGQYQVHITRAIEATSPGTMDDRSEHFGFADGISNPVFAGDPGAVRLSAEERRLHLLATGEFLLGWDNAYGRQTPVPRIREAEATPFGHNGSYLVLRQLQQHVAAFRDWCAHAGRACDLPARTVAAKAVGRWPDGSPLALCPAGPNSALADANEFTYAADALGDGCPFGAHLRRTNPRDSLNTDRDIALRDANTHRILRRGRSYGPRFEAGHSDRDPQRGLVFLCLNANPERQFEFVQQSWVNNAAFNGLVGERDPIIGTIPEHGGSFTIPAAPQRIRTTGLQQFVTMRGGAYFFLPSRTGLAELAAL
jgi:Dyp-type peroxidase family